MSKSLSTSLEHRRARHIVDFIAVAKQITAKLPQGSIKVIKENNSVSWYLVSYPGSERKLKETERSIIWFEFCVCIVPSCSYRLSCYCVHFLVQLNFPDDKSKLLPLQQKQRCTVQGGPLLGAIKRWKCGFFLIITYGYKLKDIHMISVAWNADFSYKLVHCSVCCQLLIKWRHYLNILTLMT